jgi:hypothetical protein
VRLQKEAVLRELQVQRQTLADAERRCRQLEHSLTRQSRYAAWVDRAWRQARTARPRPHPAHALHPDPARPSGLQALAELDRVTLKLAAGATSDDAAHSLSSFLPWVVATLSDDDAAQPNGEGVGAGDGNGGGVPEELAASVNAYRWVPFCSPRHGH